ncbi:MAG: glycosyltransferase, partial [Akkermansiaceae bacterium]|nr:glycosyltransferase [Akkermansiaceae bacterium]
KANPNLHLKFVYIDLSASALRWKKWIRPQFLAVSWYYSQWQKKAFLKIKELEKTNHYDVIHHLTFASFRLPFAVTGHTALSIIGPVGGCEEFPEELLPERGWRVHTKEIFRNLVTRFSTGFGLGMSKYRQANQVIASTDEMKQVFADHGIKSLVMPQIGVTRDLIGARSRKDRKDVEVRLLFVGAVLSWKGLELAVQALALLPQGVSLTIIGGGPDERLLRKEIKRLNLTNRVHFLGRMPHAEVLNHYQNYDLFMYPSMHDSGSFTVLEAMASGLPVICLDRGGPALSVNNNCGRIVKSGSRTETINSLSLAVSYYLDNPEQIAEQGTNAKQRLLNLYDWRKKCEVMAGIYDDATGRN